MKFVPRSYQKKSFDDTIEYIKGGGKAGYIVLPTGTGKSFVIAMLVEHLVKLGNKVLVLQPSVELLKQNISKYHLINTSVKASIYSASISKDLTGVTYATLGSIKALGKNFRHLGVNYVIVDECDSKYPQGNKSMFGKFLLDMKPKVLIGLTATPYRYHSTLAHGNKLKYLHDLSYKRFTDVIHITQIEDISKDYWAEFKILRKTVKTDSLKLNSTGVSFTQESVDKFVGINNSTSDIINLVTLLLKQGRDKVLVFCPSVDIAEFLATKFKSSAVVSSRTKTKDRRVLVEDFKNGKIKVMFNFSVFSIGFDYPELDTIVLANPIGSFKLYYQILGRIVRPFKDKLGFVYDLGGNFVRFGNIKDLEHVVEEGKLVSKIGSKVLTGVRLNPVSSYEARVNKKY